MTRLRVSWVGDAPCCAVIPSGAARFLAALGMTPFALLLVSPATLQAQVPIKEWPVPYADSRPRDPYVDREDRVWFVGQVGNYLGYLDPERTEAKTPPST